MTIRRDWNPGIAAALSIFLPGVGQMYKGYVLSGFFWFFLIVIGYICFIVPGVLLHFCCVVSAAVGRSKDEVAEGKKMLS